MAAAQLGFLHSTISPKNSQGEEQPAEKNRLADYLDNDLDPPLVEIIAGQHIWQAFVALGIYKHGGMGPLPLEWIDIWAYSQATGRVTEPWELETLHEMSGAYLANLERGKDPFARSPVDLEE